MNSFEINKILGGLLGTCLVLLAVHIASNAIFSPSVMAKPGYEIAVKEEQSKQPSGGAATPAAAPFETLLASASVDRGTQGAKVCLICHNIGKSEGSKVGPDLYGVVGRPLASEAGFNYSAALKAKGGTWTFDALNTWLADPRADVPGTLMTFAGVPSGKQRADIIAFLNSNSDKPLPLPKTAEKQGGAASPPAGAPASPPAAAPASPPAAAAPGNGSTPKPQ